MESNHIKLRTRIKRLVRRTICFSKTEHMHALVIGLFVNRFECGRLVERVIHNLIPNVPLTGAMAVVMVIPGLLTAFTEPAAGSPIIAGACVPITAKVRMMCGCMIDNLFWPSANFNVQAIVSHAEAVHTLPLSYTGSPSLFSERHVFQTPGNYEIRLIASAMNGNSGSTAPVSVNVQRK